MTDTTIPVGSGFKLPPLNPLHITKARSTLATLTVAIGAIAPLLPDGFREVAADAHGLVGFFDGAVAAVTGLIDAANVVLVLGGTAWLWFERRAPSYRLSFKAA